MIQNDFLNLQGKQYIVGSPQLQQKKNMNYNN